MSRLGLAAITVVAAAAAAAAAAATLGVGGRALGAGDVAVVPCDSDGFTVSYTTVAGDVSAVTVDGMDAACAGGVLSLTVTGTGGAAIASGGPHTVAAASANVSVSPQPAAEDAAAVEIAITGP